LRGFYAELVLLFRQKMPTTPTSIAQIDEWKAAKSETEHLEFKEARDKFEFYKLLEYCVALANENENGSVLLLGVTDKPPRVVVGTKAFPSIPKVSSDLFDKLRFRIAVEEVMYTDRRVLIFRIPSRPIGHPYELDGKFLMRSGGQLVPMTVDQLKKIFAEKKSGSRSAPAYFAAGFLLAASLAGILWFKRSPVTTNQPPITANRALEKSSETQISPDTHARSAVPPTSDTTPLLQLQSSHSVKAAKQPPTQSAPAQTVPTQNVSPPVLQNASPAPQTFQERVIQNNKALPKSDRERLADAFYQFAKNLDEGTELMYKGFHEGAAVGGEQNNLSKSLPAHIAKLRELAASAKEYGKVSMALRTKWDYYREPTLYVFGDNPDNLGWGKLANAFDGYAYHLEIWSAIQNKDNQLVLNMLSEYKSEFEAMLTEYSRFNQGCKARLEEMKTSIR
jgi:hypothetical protein